MINIFLNKIVNSFVNQIRAYLKIAKVQLKFELVYKVNYWFGLVAMFLKILMAWFLWKSLYKGGVSHNELAYSLDNMLLYTVVGIAIYSTFSTGSVGKISNLINNGDIVFTLIRPLSFQLRCLAEDIGGVINNILLKFPIVFIVSLIAFKLNLSIISLNGFLLFIMFLILGFLILFLIDYICGLLCFWTTQAWSINFAKKQLLFILSGSFIPLWVFPDKFQAILKWTPFPFIYSVPLEALIGKFNYGSSLEIVFVQIVWIVILLIISRILWYVGSKIIFVQGG